MFHKRLARLALAGLLATATTSGLAAVMATSASAGPVGVQSGCKFVLSKVTGNRLQEARVDEIYLGIGANTTKSVKFREGETHLASEFGTSAQTTEFIATAGPIAVSVNEADFPSADEVLGSFVVFCTTGHFTQTVTGFGSNYDVVFDVVVA